MLHHDLGEVPDAAARREPAREVLVLCKGVPDEALVEADLQYEVTASAHEAAGHVLDVVRQVGLEDVAWIAVSREGPLPPTAREAAPQTRLAVDDPRAVADDASCRADDGRVEERRLKRPERSGANRRIVIEEEDDLACCRSRPEISLPRQPARRRQVPNCRAGLLRHGAGGHVPITVDDHDLVG